MFWGFGILSFIVSYLTATGISLPSILQGCIQTMKTSTRFIGKLKVKDKQALNEFVKHSESHSVRSRSKAILLSSQGRTVAELAHDFQVSHNTIYAWLDRW